MRTNPRTSVCSRLENRSFPLLPLRVVGRRLSSAAANKNVHDRARKCEKEKERRTTRTVVKTSRNTKNYSKKGKGKRRKNKERKGREKKRNGILNVRLVTFSYIFLRPTPRRIFFPCRSARPRPRQFRGKYVKQNVDDLLRSLSSAGSASRERSLVSPSEGYIPRRTWGYIHAGFTRDIFVLKSRILPVPRIRPTHPYGYGAL